jgi:uncharacterized protein (UPF0218 family)
MATNDKKIVREKVLQVLKKALNQVGQIKSPTGEVEDDLIKFRVSSSMKTTIEQYCGHRGVSVSEWLRNLAQVELARNKHR